MHGYIIALKMLVNYYGDKLQGIHPEQKSYEMEEKMCRVDAEGVCPKCNCEKWKNIVGDTFSKNTNLFSSIGASVPMYFGRRIDYCPWCGCHLTNNTAHGEQTGASSDKK